jgi:hypothetical protein
LFIHDAELRCAYGIKRPPAIQGRRSSSRGPSRSSPSACPGGSCHRIVCGAGDHRIRPCLWQAGRRTISRRGPGDGASSRSCSSHALTPLPALLHGIFHVVFIPLTVHFQNSSAALYRGKGTMDRTHGRQRFPLDRERGARAAMQHGSVALHRWVQGDRSISLSPQLRQEGSIQGFRTSQRRPTVLGDRRLAAKSLIRIFAP